MLAAFFFFCYSIAPVAPPNQPTSTQNFFFVNTHAVQSLPVTSFFKKSTPFCPAKTLSSLIISFTRFFFFFFSLHFASGVLPAGWSIARWRLLAGASCAFVWLPLFAGLVNASGTWLSASARLLGASDYAGIASALLAATGVTLLFECSSDVVSSSHVFADNLDRTAGLVAGHLSILITFACAALWVRE